MTLKGWPLVFLALLSGSNAATSGTTVTEHLVTLRDPGIFQGEALEVLLGELSFDPEVRIAVASSGLRVLAGRRITKVGPPSALKPQLIGLAGLVAREAFNAGMDPGYMVRLANRESHFDPFAKSPTSTAAGLFQFTNNTWLCSLREFGPGLGVAGSDQIWRTRRGVCETSAPGERSRLLALRSDALLSTRVAAAFSLHNYNILLSTLGRPPSRSELYALHFFGEKAGLKFLFANAETPTALAFSFWPAGARSNPNIFFGPRSRAKRVFEVFESLRLAEHSGLEQWPRTRNP